MNKISPNNKFKSWNSETKEWYYPDHDKEPLYFGNTENSIDWDLLIKSVEDKEGCI
jgi:hypothetical protein